MRLSLSVDVNTLDYSEILPDLFVASKQVGQDKNLLRKLRVSGVVCCTTQKPSMFRGIKVLWVPVSDTAAKALEFRQWFKVCAKFISDILETGRSCVVHCSAGVSRSPTIVIAYLMLHKRMSLFEAFSHVRDRRSFVNPNVGFMKQLVKEEMETFDSSSLCLDAFKMNSFSSPRSLMLKRTTSLSTVSDDSASSSEDTMDESDGTTLERCSIRQKKTSARFF